LVGTASRIARVDCRLIPFDSPAAAGRALARGEITGIAGFTYDQALAMQLQFLEPYRTTQLRAVVHATSPLRFAKDLPHAACLALPQSFGAVYAGTRGWPTRPVDSPGDAMQLLKEEPKAAFLTDWRKDMLPPGFRAIDLEHQAPVGLALAPDCSHSQALASGLRAAEKTGYAGRLRHRWTGMETPPRPMVEPRILSCAVLLLLAAALLSSQKACLRRQAAPA